MHILIPFTIGHISFKFMSFDTTSNLSYFIILYDHIWISQVFRFVYCLYLLLFETSQFVQQRYKSKQVIIKTYLILFNLVFNANQSEKTYT